MRDGRGRGSDELTRESRGYKVVEIQTGKIERRGGRLQLVKWAWWGQQSKASKTARDHHLPSIT